MEKTDTPSVPKGRYTAGLEKALRELHAVQQRIGRTSLLRLLVFAATITGIVLARHNGWSVIATIAAAGLVLFLSLIKRHNRQFTRKAWLETEAEVYRQELAALEHDFFAFSDGAEYADPAHLYAYDLDVFGPRSLFQSLNRTCTGPGHRQLAVWLGKHLENKADIEARQAAVSELKDLPDFRHRFRVSGLLHKGKAANADELNAWASAPSAFRHRRWIRLLPAIITTANAAGLILTVSGLIPGSVWATAWCAFLTLSFCFTGRISRMQVVYGKKLQILGVYARLLRLIDDQPLQNPLLKRLKASVSGNGHMASAAIARLDKLMNALDQRNNYLMYALLNGTFCWELWQVMRIEAWKEQHASKLPVWLQTIGETDALCSMGTFAYNHPDYPFPILTEKSYTNPADNTSVRATDKAPFLLRGEGLGHPLMKPGQCVRNDIDMHKRPAFIIITGANMAGKSTYLRTVGINFLLACTGMPVCARRMEVSPARLVTSLRTSDSLADNESYFFAELKRLKLIIDKLQAGEQMFIILDEILKGTNSTDKQKGSLALVKQFMRLNANGIIATHDLLLGTLAEQFPNEISNYCFEAEIKGDRLTFPYHMRPGLAHNMNACFLMEKMGITVNE